MVLKQQIFIRKTSLPALLNAFKDGDNFTAVGRLFQSFGAEKVNEPVSHPGSGSDRTIASVRQVTALAMLYIGELVTCGIDHSFTP